MVWVRGLQDRIYILFFVRQASLIMITHRLCILKVSVQPIPKIQVMHQVKCCAPHVERFAYHELLIQRLTGGGGSTNVKILAVASSSTWRPLHLVYYIAMGRRSGQWYGERPPWARQQQAGVCVCICRTERRRPERQRP
ncbi:DNA topoisomerase 3-alpha [Zea mays]|uniref:DNA topoisomerase 3-alpha n=1 Tax=Zea mays TaxID=4577 RepID=A0A1D6JPR4_MAIZE|nr:DNA topoisomerase 3-alpha [Zea mays]